MTELGNGAGALLIVVGLAYVSGAVVGLVRLPDLYTRAHAAGKCDTVGSFAILAGLALVGGLDVADLKLVLLAVLVVVTAPTAAHALARSAYRRGVAPWRRPERGAP
ncbi:MAG: monovalent cation/H(+) antiporter subunit G [Trueperaceae bacterium]